MALEDSPEVWTLWISETDGSQSWFAPLTTRIEATEFYLWSDMSKLITKVEGDLWSIDLQTSKRLRLTDTPDVDEYPISQSPRGSDRLLCMAAINQFDGYLVSVSLNGEYEKVGEGDTGFAFGISSDGTTLAYGDVGQTAYLEKIGSHRTEIDMESYGIAGAFKLADVSFSPDGTKLAWNIYFEDKPNLISVVVIDLANREHSIVAEYVPVGRGGFFPAPVWSPDGNRLIFLKETFNEYEPGVYVADLVEGSLIRISDYQPNWYRFDWSPDGNWVVENDTYSRILFINTHTWSQELWDPSYKVRTVTWVDR